MRRGCSELYGFWNTYWMRSRCAVVRSRADCARRSEPSRISPVHSRCRPPIDRDSVVLPEPDSPTSARHSPRSTCRSTLCTTWCPVYDAHTIAHHQRVRGGCSDRRRVRRRRAECAAAPRTAGCSEPDGLAPTSRSAGNSARHASVASSQRMANEQPTGRRPGAGARPLRPTISWSVDMSGAAAIRCRVYGCADCGTAPQRGPARRFDLRTSRRRDRRGWRRRRGRG